MEAAVQFLGSHLLYIRLINRFDTLRFIISWVINDG